MLGMSGWLKSEGYCNILYCNIAIWHMPKYTSMHVYMYVYVPVPTYRYSTGSYCNTGIAISVQHIAILNNIAMDCNVVVMATIPVHTYEYSRYTALEYTARVLEYVYTVSTCTYTVCCSGTVKVAEYSHLHSHYALVVGFAFVFTAVLHSQSPRPPIPQRSNLVKPPTSTFSPCLLD